MSPGPFRTYSCRCVTSLGLPCVLTRRYPCPWRVSSMLDRDCFRRYWTKVQDQPLPAESAVGRVPVWSISLARRGGRSARHVAVRRVRPVCLARQWDGATIRRWGASGASAAREQRALSACRRSPRPSATRPERGRPRGAKRPRCPRHRGSDHEAEQDRRPENQAVERKPLPHDTHAAADTLLDLGPRSAECPTHRRERAVPAVSGRLRDRDLTQNPFSVGLLALPWVSSGRGGRILSPTNL